MQAIILAAGMGKRLGGYTHDNTKCMLKVNGVRLVDRALESLHNVGVSSVVMVVGYKSQNVIDYLGHNFKGMPITYVENKIYDRTNNIYSLFLAKDYLLKDDTILLESDLIFDPSILAKLVDDSAENIAVVDKYESWMDGTVVTIDDAFRISGFIDKAGFRYDMADRYFKTVNIYKFSKDFSSRYYVPFLSAYTTSMGDNEYYEQVLRVILHLHHAPLKALPLSGEKWYEIDDIQDLDIASGMFAPTLDEQYSSITSRFGGYWRYPQLLDFCYLVNPYFPSIRMKEEIRASFGNLLAGYPSGMKVNSLLASKNFGVCQDRIVIGNGAAELIKELMEGYSGVLGNILPTFEEYPNRLSKENVINYIPCADGFRYSADDVMHFFSDKRIDALLLINPDNPSGNYIPHSDVLRLIAWAGQRNIRFILDESFVDFSDEQSTMLDDELLMANSHLFVVKSISKSYGVPGIRLGVLASGDVEAITKIKNKVSIWNINSFGEYFMQILEKYKKDYSMACLMFKKERDRFKQELSDIPFLRVFPSQANYYLCEVISCFTSRELAVRLLGENILVKDCSSKNGFDGKSYIRIAVRNRTDNDRIIAALLQIKNKK